MIKIIFGCVLMVVFVFPSISNLVTAILFFTKGKTGSMVPVIGGLSGAGSLYFLFPNQFSLIWWVPFVLDAGCMLWFILVAGKMLGAFPKK